MTNGPNFEQLEAFLETIDREALERAHEETAYGNAESAFCVSCAQEYNDINFRVGDGCQCTACGEMAVYPVEYLVDCGEHQGTR